MLVIYVPAYKLKLKMKTKMALIYLFSPTIYLDRYSIVDHPIIDTVGCVISLLFVSSLCNNFVAKQDFAHFRAAIRWIIQVDLGIEYDWGASDSIGNRASIMHDIIALANIYNIVAI